MLLPPVPLGEWAPDTSDLVISNALTIAQNVYPHIDSYFRVLGLFAQGDALPMPATNLWFVQKTNGSYDTYAATRARLYRYDADTLAFVDVSRLVGGDYGCPSDDRWSGKQYGDRLIVCQLGDVPQFINIDSGTNFAALPGSPSTARFVDVMDDKVIFSCLASNPRMIMWSDVNDSEEYVTGLAGNQEFVDHGAVMGFFPHARIVLLERGMHSIVSTGDIYSFNFPETFTEKGTISPYSCIEYGNRLYYLSVDDFYVVSAAMDEPVAIGRNRIIRDFFTTLNYTRVFQIQGAFDPFTGRILWAFPTGDTEYNDRIQVFDPSLPTDIGPFGRWSQLSVDTYTIARLATAGVSLEGGSDPEDIDEPGLPSLDSRIYMAGAPVLIAVGTDLKLSSFAGDSLAATLETGTYTFGDGMRTRVQSFMPFVFGDQADQITVKVSKKKNPAATWSTSSAISQQASGRHPMNADGMFHKFQIVMPAGIAWTHAQSWRAEVRQASRR